jgi:hypothetical protein
VSSVGARYGFCCGGVPHKNHAILRGQGDVCCASGENATEKTDLVCSVKGPTTTSPVVASHKRIVQSSEADAMSRASGEKPKER